MQHKPIQFQDLSLVYPHKICFEAFSGQICAGSRIAIIGRNGSGKSTLLKFLCGLCPSTGDIKVPKDVRFGYVPQMIEDFAHLSGGQRLNQVLTKILAENPNVLLLDEPTNHLDQSNRRAFLHMLYHYEGTLIIATHDTELINMADILWHIESGKITVFTGSYWDYQRMLAEKKGTIEQEISNLSRQKKEAHLALMKEQKRISKSRAKGQKNVKSRKWTKMVGDLKGMKAEKSQGKKLQNIEHKKQVLSEQLASIYIPEVIKPTFKLRAEPSHKLLLSIQDASIAYENGPLVLENIGFSMTGQERVALNGDNDCGKSTFVRAILGDTRIKRSGEWIVPDSRAIGYLDQHYQHLNFDETVLELVKSKMPLATHAEIRAHLNEFLFRKNEEVDIQVKNLSGGEKARLSLALIAAFPPKLLILDELTNNVDLETRTHIIEVLAEFPGAMLIISHDEDFLKAIGIDTHYRIFEGKIL